MPKQEKTEELMTRHRSEGARQRRAEFFLREGFLDDQKSRALNRLIPFDNPSECTRKIEAEIMSGASQILDIFENGHRIGFAVYEIIDLEFLCIALHGKSGADITSSVLPQLETIARRKDCQTMRAHTMRPGLVKKLIKDDWFISEIVMRKEL